QEPLQPNLLLASPRHRPIPPKSPPRSIPSPLPLLKPKSPGAHARTHPRVFPIPNLPNPISQRNALLIAAALLLYWILFSVTSLVVKLDHLQQRVDKLKKRDD
uniref:Uncharacterized protein n=1 Tax=Aegilops tauschii subsp. strangulata TaxID=200361 RepID=A0A453PI85_AEGTS